MERERCEQMLQTMVQVERVVEEGGVGKMLQAGKRGRRRGRRQIMQAEEVMKERGVSRCCRGPGG